MDVLDICIVVGYFVSMMLVGLWSMTRGKTDTTEDYFLAGRTTKWFLVGTSTFATNIGAQTFIGLSGSAAAGGIAVVMYEWNAMFMLVLLGWLFLPTYLSSGCLTMPEYIRLRFGGQRISTFLAVLKVFGAISVEISGQMYAGALFFQEIFEWSLYPSVITILIITACFSTFGGLKTVLWTDALQSVILLIGATILSFISLSSVGGFNSMREQFLRSASNETYYAQSTWDNRSCGTISSNAFSIYRPANDGGYPWTGMLLGMPILATNAWCTDQNCVQRPLSAKTLSHGKAGLLLAGYLKVTPFLLFIIPGMISRILYPDEVGCSDPVLCESICSNPGGCSNIAYPLLVDRILPTGMRGIMFSALIAALISSLTSIFNSVSTVFTLEIWKQIRRKATENELMVVSRIFILCLVAISLVWLPILQLVQGSNFWDYLQSFAAFLVPPIIAIFLMGLLWTRATEQGAFTALVLGENLGFIRLGLEWSHPAPDCGSDEPDDRYKLVTRVHYLHFAAISFAISCIVIFVVSLVTTPRTKQQLRGMTHWTKHHLQENNQTQSTSTCTEVRQGKKIGNVQTEVTTGEAQSYKEMKTWKHVLLKVLCGVQAKKDVSVPEAEGGPLTICEDPWWRRFMNVQAIVCCGAAVVLHAFWV